MNDGGYFLASLYIVVILLPFVGLGISITYKILNVFFIILTIGRVLVEVWR